jgi:hypothetical protein
MWANTFREERSEIEGLFENVKTMCEQNENAPLPSDYVERYVGVGVFFCVHCFLPSISLTVLVSCLCSMVRLCDRVEAKAVKMPIEWKDKWEKITTITAVQMYSKTRK